MPDVIMSSAKSLGNIPISSCRWKSRPDFCKSSTDSGANMSSLNRRISQPNPHFHPTLPRREEGGSLSEKAGGNTHLMLK